MSRFMKTIRIIFSLLIIILSVFSYIAIEGDSELGLDMNTLQDIFIKFSMKEYGFYIISVVVGIVIAGAIILFISTVARKTKTSNLTLVDDGGRVVLTDDAIEAYVERSIKNFPELEDVKLNCKILGRRSKKVVARVKAGVNNATDLSSLSVQIKDKVKSDIDTFIGKDISDVDIILDNISVKGTNNEVNNEINNESDSMKIE